MTAPSDLDAALERVWEVLATAPWRTRPKEAKRLFDAASDRLRRLASTVDPESWPRAVRTYLWRHPRRPP